MNLSICTNNISIYHLSKCRQISPMNRKAAGVGCESSSIYFRCLVTGRIGHMESFHDSTTSFLAALLSRRAGPSPLLGYLSSMYVKTGAPVVFVYLSSMYVETGPFTLLVYPSSIPGSHCLHILTENGEM